MPSAPALLISTAGSGAAFTQETSRIVNNNKQTECAILPMTFLLKFIEKANPNRIGFACFVTGQ
jgi:hypothetical protein